MQPTEQPRVLYKSIGNIGIEYTNQRKHRNNREFNLDLYKWIVCRKEPRGYSRAKVVKSKIHNSEPSL